MKAARKQPYRNCPLCGFEFQQDDTLCEHGCPLRTHCHLIRCPSCAYEFHEVPAAPSWLQRLFGRRKPKSEGEDCELRSLRQLRSGDRAEVVAVNGRESSRRNTLALFGLVPGSEITLIQRRPAYVVRVGETEIALEGDIAGEILVKPLPGAGRGVAGRAGS